MTCEGCVASVTRSLQRVAGVQDVDVSLGEQRAKVTYDPARIGVVTSPTSVAVPEV